MPPNKKSPEGLHISDFSHGRPQFPGVLAAHAAYRLPLLPSGPDGVHRAPLRETKALQPALRKINKNGGE